MDTSLPAPKRQKVREIEEIEIENKSAVVQEPKKSIVPTVVRLRRTGGKVVQGCDVYIGRKLNMGGWNLPASKWANPFTVKECGSVAKAVAKYRDYLSSRPDLLSALTELEGKTLGCWCVFEKEITYSF